MKCGPQRSLMRVAIATCVLLVGNSARAQNSEKDTPDFPGLDIQAVVGFDRMIERSAPVSASFLVTNNSEKLLEGELILRDVESGNSISLGSVAVGPGGKKRISTVQSFEGWENVEAEYTDGFTTFWKRRTFLDNERSITHLDSVLLVVDSGGRRIAFNEETLKEENQGIVDEIPMYVPGIGQGNRVLALSIRDWQVPIHPGPLTTIRAVAFSETTKVDFLGDSQWEAVGRWICFGGHVFIPESAPALIEKIKSVCPLAVQPPASRDGMSAHMAGLGTIFVYPGALFATGDDSAALAVAKQTSMLSGIGLFKAINERQLAFPTEGRSYQTRNWVMMVFGVYTLIIGAVTLALFRLSRSRLKVFVASVVGLACVASAALGVMLRTSLGDATIVTVTQLAESGAIQVAEIDVQSAGGRNFDLAVQGSNVDLQLSEVSDRSQPNYYNYGPLYGMDYYGSAEKSTFAPAFSIMTNLSDRKADAFQIRVPVRPWEQRSCMATSCLPALTGLRVELSYQLSANHAGQEVNSPEDVQSLVTAHELSEDQLLNGVWSVDVQNHTGLEIEAMTIVLSRSVVAGENLRGQFNFDLNDLKKSEFELIQIFTESQVAMLTTESGQVTMQISPNFRPSNVDWSERNLQAKSSAPRGATFAWLIGTMRKSPGIMIDEANSDFRTSSVENHVVSLYLPEERLPKSWRAAHAWLLQKKISAERERLRQHFEILKQSQSQVPNR